MVSEPLAIVPELRDLASLRLLQEGQHIPLADQPAELLSADRLHVIQHELVRGPQKVQEEGGLGLPRRRDLQGRGVERLQEAIVELLVGLGRRQ